MIRAGWLAALLIWMAGAGGLDSNGALFAGVLLPVCAVMIYRPGVFGRATVAMVLGAGVAALAPLYRRTMENGAWGMDTSLAGMVGTWALFALIFSEILGHHRGRRGKGATEGDTRAIDGTQLAIFCSIVMLACGVLSGLGGVQCILLSAAAGLMVYAGATLDELALLSRLRALALALAIVTAHGVWTYVNLQNGATQLEALVNAGRSDETVPLYQALREAGAGFKSRAVQVRLDRAWATDAENRGDLAEAATRWRRAAETEGVSPENYAPLLRVDCKFGLSVPVWRKLVYGGFPAINNPELGAGIERLQSAPKSDLRARLLSALLAWERNAPEPERLAKLKAVQDLAPGEANSLALLERLGVRSALKEWGLPKELLVGERPTYDPLGSLDELGEVSTVLVLNPGKYELTLLASASPLDEEWPLARVEINGRPIGSSRILSTRLREVPFTFEVTSPDISRVTVRLVNYTRPTPNGLGTHSARRGLNLAGIVIRRP